MSKDTIYREDAIKALRCEYPMMPMFKSLREEWAIKTEGFRKAEEVIMSVPSADRPQDDDWEKYSDKLWKLAYERGKEDEKKWWSGFCAKCTDADRERGEWIDTKGGWRCTACNKWANCASDYCPNCGSKMRGEHDQ